MADGLREALARFVPEAALDEAVEALKTTEIAPEWYRNDIAKVGAEAKEAGELKARLASIESAPRRKEALKRVGIDYDSLPKYGQKALDAIPAEDLDSLDKVAEFVQAEGFEAHVSAEQQAQSESGADAITEATVAMGMGAPTRTTVEARRSDFLTELDKVPDDDKAGIAAVLEKFGMAGSTTQE